MSYDGLYYFGNVPDEFIGEHADDLKETDWDPNYYYRIRVSYRDAEIKVEDSCGRMVPFQFKDIKTLRRVLKTIKKEINDE